jgi:hypothetical protein
MERREEILIEATALKLRADALNAQFRKEMSNPERHNDPSYRDRITKINDELRQITGKMAKLAAEMRSIALGILGDRHPSRRNDNNNGFDYIT